MMLHSVLLRYLDSISRDGVKVSRNSDGKILSKEFNQRLLLRQFRCRSVMWVIPFLIVNAALFVLILVAACIVTVGFSTFCDNYLRDLEKLGITE